MLLIGVVKTTLGAEPAPPSLINLVCQVTDYCVDFAAQGGEGTDYGECH
jgi:hypothetical protein